MSTIRRQLLQLLQDRAVIRGDFVLASGQRSNYYIDGRMVEVHPAGAKLIGELLYERLEDVEFEAAGGLAVGAVPLVTAFVIACAEHGRSMEGFWVRDAAKTHGMQRLVEGKLAARDRVVVLDDVITSGRSAEKAVEAVEALGASVVKVIALVDRQQGAQELFAARKLPYEAIFSKDELLAPLPAS